jgi:hypothetical protein
MLNTVYMDDLKIRHNSGHVKPCHSVGLLYDAINPNLNIACTGSDKLTQEQLTQEIHYDPETGQFRQMTTARGVTKPSLRIGTIRPSTGYIQIRINGVVYPK